MDISTPRMPIILGMGILANWRMEIMGWSLGSDQGRDIGYGVPAYCDHPECNEVIDRGLAYVCGGDVVGGEFGCGLFFCSDHLGYVVKENEPMSPQLCDCCAKRYSDEESEEFFDPKPDHPDWIRHKLTDESWEQWRSENPDWVKANSPEITEFKPHD
jgi:hypothetical protein